MARRIIFTIIVLLTFGVILNTLAAWTCVAISRHRLFDARRLGQLRAAKDEAELQSQVRIIEPASDVYLALYFDRPGSSVLMQEEGAGNLAKRRTIHEAGWPAFSFRAEQSRDIGGRKRNVWGLRLGTLDMGFPSLPSMSGPTPALPAPGMRLGSKPLATMPPPPPLAPSQTADRLLPLRPLWPGFATNSVFYAVIAWLLWMLFTMAMRMQRRLRRRCGGCAYPIGVSPVCTECGRKVRLNPASAR